MLIKIIIWLTGFGCFFGLSCWPLDDDVDDVDVVDVVVACTCRQREQATVRLRVKGSVAHVVWCDVSKSKQKEVLLNSGQC